MKIKLMMQSLFPLFLLMIIKNWDFCTEEKGNELTFSEFIIKNLVLLGMMLVCGIWVILSGIFYIQFKVYTMSGKTGGYQVKNVQKDEETSLNFFVTIILPLLLDGVNEIRGALVFGIIIFMLCALLYKTNLYFYNPILSILGYHFYEFEFVENRNNTGKYIGISANCIYEEMACEYKAITDKVFFIVGEKNGKRKN